MAFTLRNFLAQPHVGTELRSGAALVAPTTIYLS